MSMLDDQAIINDYKRKTIYINVPVIELGNKVAYLKHMNFSCYIRQLILEDAKRNGLLEDKDTERISS
jgi:hypothetical protein